MDLNMYTTVVTMLLILALFQVSGGSAIPANPSLLPQGPDVNLVHSQLIASIAHQDSILAHHLSHQSSQLLPVNDPSSSASPMLLRMTELADKDLTAFSPKALALLQEAVIDEQRNPIGAMRRSEKVKQSLVKAWMDVTSGSQIDIPRLHRRMVPSQGIASAAVESVSRQASQGKFTSCNNEA